MWRVGSRMRASQAGLTNAAACRSFATSEKLFDKILIANRGEIACRVMRSAQKLGIKTVAVYSEADRHSVHTMMADEAVCVGPAPTSLSYLNQTAILDAIKSTGAQAVHPGYGFLSENASFCDLLEKNGVSFIGPKPYAMTSMGDKIASKRIAREAKVNTIPGWLGQVADADQVVKVAQEIGYPVMIKASAGGGGKGMRVAYNDQEAREGFLLSQQEAKASFGDDTIFLEKFIECPRHIEIQILMDSHGNGVYLNERECSIQRRNQKVIEEAPSVFLDPETRKAMGEQALALARAVDYQSAGTVEFLVDKNKNFYFLEMNTRLQVEHPISEAITGVDIVEQMIRVAAGHQLPFTQDDIGIHGWAIESRVYAEDPLNNFLPSIGTLRRYQEPSGPGVRVDSGIREGSEISIHYDPMISKLVTHGATREEALARMRTALDNYVIGGLRHNVSFLRALCDHPTFIEGRLSTNFIPEEYPQGFKGPAMTAERVRQLVAAALNVHLQRMAARADLSQASPYRWMDKRLRQFFVRFPDNTTFRVDMDEGLIEEAPEIVEGLKESNASYAFSLTKVEGPANRAVEETRFDIEGTDAEVLQIWGNYDNATSPFAVDISDGEGVTSAIVQSVAASDASSRYTLSFLGETLDIEVYSPAEFAALQHMPVKEALNTEKMVLSPMPGKMVSIGVKVGDQVVPGQEVCVIEAMKMQNSLRAATAATVKSINVKVGQTVAVEEVLIEFE